MSTAALICYLLAAVTAAVLVWQGVRALCLRHARGGQPEIPPAPVSTTAAAADGTDEADRALAAQPVAVVYKKVLLRRLAGLLLCMAALAAWLADVHYAATLILAGAGCLLQYLAYKIRTAYALAVSKEHRRFAEAQVRGGQAPCGPDGHGRTEDETIKASSVG